MNHRDVWSLSLGRWGGVQIRLHIFFVLFGVFTGYLAWRDPNEDSMQLALVSIAVLFFSVLLHELGHYVAMRRLGGHMEALVLGPLGGLRPVRVSKDPQSELLAVLAGPATTLTICFMGLLLSVVLVGKSDHSHLLNPLTPQFNGGGFSQFVQLVCWVNWWLFVVNLIPAFPFDGGRAFGALIQVVKPDVDNHQATSMVATFARLVAILLFVLAFVFRDVFPESPVPSWTALVLLSVFVFFSARVEEGQLDADDEDSELFGYDFSQGYTSLERSTAPPSQPRGPISRWLDRMREKRRLKQEAIAAAEDRQADDILRRLHEEGMDSLSAEERALLRRVSARLRTREDL